MKHPISGRRQGACGISYGCMSPRPDPAAYLQLTLAEWRRRGSGDLWIFGYGSLIWRPELDFAECRAALVHGRHRALAMRSRVNRGTWERPGLVFALVDGGSCRGVAYRLPAERVEADLATLWQREMPTGVYDPKWLPCRTLEGRLDALAFTLSRESPAYAGRVEEAQLIDILRHARGRFGTTLHYVVETDTSLRERGIRDRDVERIVALARANGLL